MSAPPSLAAQPTRRSHPRQPAPKSVTPAAHVSRPILTSIPKPRDQRGCRRNARASPLAGLVLVTPATRRRNGRTPLEGCDGWRVPRRTRVIVPGTTSHRNPLATRRPPICQATDKLPSISHDQRRVVGLHRSARVGNERRRRVHDHPLPITLADRRTPKRIRRRGRHREANRCVLRPGSEQRGTHWHHDDG